MKTKSKLILLTIAMLAAAPWATAANPTLEAYERGIEDPAAHSRALRLGSLDLRMNLLGAIAESTVTARFENPSDELLEGRFSFELPEGAVVTGYALDIEGVMIDGVLVEPLKAKREYEERVRQRVDPGIASVSRANVFSTSVYPIPGNGGRTIRLQFVAPIHPDRGLVLALATRQAIGRFAVEVRAAGVASAPVLTLPNALAPDWRPVAGHFTAAARLSGQALRGELRLAPVKTSAPALASRHTTGASFFQIADRAGAAEAPAATGKRLRVYWDRSLSRRDDLLDEELELLEQHIARSKPQSIDLVVFNSSGARVQRIAPENVRAVLGAVLYRGATSFGVLGNLAAPPADQCLVFSDGVVTIDARPDFDPGCEVSAITSAPDADRGFLQRLTHGGAMLQVDREPEAQMLARLAGNAPRVIEARGDDGRRLPFAVLDGGTHGWAIVGQAPAAGAVMLRIAGIGRGVIERRYVPAPSDAAGFSGAGALWAADRVAALAASDAAQAELAQVSRKYSVASPALSFIVLESPADYVEADIAPPPNYPKTLRAEYRELKAAHDQERKELAEARLAEVIEQWDEQQRWWNTSFPRERRPQIAAKAQVLASAEVSAPARAPHPAEMAQLDAISSVELDAVVVTGMRASGDPRGDAAPISVELAQWNPDRPYLAVLDAAAPERIDRVIAREEQKNAQSPAFYFDVAEWLYRKDRPVEAAEMLLSALELAAANELTTAMVADRLLRHGRFDRAVWLYERALAQSDDLPQPRRTLALALAKRAAAHPARARADLIRAVTLLNEVVTTPWPGSYDGIELIALMDLNPLLPKLSGLGVTRTPVDERLRALLEVDIRVVIEWNTDATDMDLWVDEPTGERAVYDHPRTDIGGRLSNDMTAGLGPEEYLLRRAVPGEYRISVNVFAGDAINPNGTTVVTAHLIRNFGRADQAEETMELELQPDESGEKTIGKFRVN